LFFIPFPASIPPKAPVKNVVSVDICEMRAWSFGAWLPMGCVTNTKEYSIIMTENPNTSDRVQPITKMSRACSSSAVCRLSGCRSVVMGLKLWVVVGLWCRCRWLHRLVAGSLVFPSWWGLGMGTDRSRRIRSLLKTWWLLRMTGLLFVYA
jgi:hypothetical protein